MTNTLLTLHDPELARRYYAEGLWRRDTLYSLMRGHAERRPDTFAVRDRHRRRSHYASGSRRSSGVGRLPPDLPGTAQTRCSGGSCRR